MTYKLHLSICCNLLNPSSVKIFFTSMPISNRSRLAAYYDLTVVVLSFLCRWFSFAYNVP
jgi:hypothetical protein